MKKPTNMEKALECWGDELPDWVRVLATESDRSNQTIVGKRLGYTNGVVGPVIARKYTGNYDNVEFAVKGAYMAQRVQCPVLGEIGSDQCRSHRNRPLRPVNPTYVALWRRCATCANNPNRGDQ